MESSFEIELSDLTEEHPPESILLEKGDLAALLGWALAIADDRFIDAGQPGLQRKGSRCVGHGGTPGAQGWQARASLAQPPAVPQG